MSIDYTKLPRLAELCDSIGDDDLSAVVELRHVLYASLTVMFFSYDRHGKNCMMKLSTYDGVTIEEMIATLEQIQAYGFRDDEEVAA